MRIFWLCGLLAAAAGLANADADFMSVRTKLAKDYSGKGGDPGEKYFRKFSSATSLFFLFFTCLMKWLMSGQMSRCKFPPSLLFFMPQLGSTATLHGSLLKQVLTI